MKKILIIGLGLIGGSVALGIKRNHPDIEIIGYDKKEVLDIAVQNKVIDKILFSFEQQVAEMDVIILAVPIQASLKLLEKLSQISLKENVLITDVGSTKTEIMVTANQYFENRKVRFIGGHPMAGSHKSGIIAADVNLFENAYYVLTQENDELQDLLSGLHAKFIILNPEEHDKITGQVSHFPHILASALVLQAKDYAEVHPLVKNLAAGGFRDLTRIAASDSQLWTSVLMTNKAVVIERIEDFKAKLDAISQKLSTGNSAEIQDFFEKGKNFREAMEIHKGALPNFYDLFVSVPDEKGVVLKVLALLQDISITNLKINEENREDIHGQLQISFKTEKDLEQARQILEQATSFKIV